MTFDWFVILPALVRRLPAALFQPMLPGMSGDAVMNDQGQLLGIRANNERIEQIKKISASRLIYQSTWQCQLIIIVIT